MSDFDDSTPQLKAVKGLIDAFVFLDPSRLDTLFSKEYQYEAPYRAPALARPEGEKHSGKIQRLLAEVAKIDVGASDQQRRTVFGPTG